MFIRFWLLCSVTLLLGTAAVWLGYRLKQSDLGLGRWHREGVTILVVGLFQALLLYAVWRLLGWTHWLQYLVSAGIGVIGVKLAHVDEMDEYAPFLVAIAQLAVLWIALGPLGRLCGPLTRRFPMFA